MTKWIIFDMDNTLIDTEVLYTNAMSEFADVMARLGFPRDRVLARQAEVDQSLLKEMGYSTDRFAKSFEITLREFVSLIQCQLAPGHVEALALEVKKIAMNVFERKSVEYEYTESVVRDCMKAGYKVGIITAGERWVQTRRFDNLSVRNLFQDCWVVLRKTKEVFNDFARKHDVNPQESWMIGDSISSDIEPAVAAGFNAIHLDTSNWVARDRGFKLPVGVVTVPNLSHIREIILGVPNNG